MVAPLQQAVSGVLRPIGAFFSGLARIGSLQSRNRELEQELDRLRQENLQALSILRENEELRKQVGLKESLDIEGIAAEVSAESVSNFEWTVTIDRGASDGVRLKMPVVTGDGLVGHVVETAANSSKVQLIIDPRSFVAAKLVSSNERGGVEGQRNQDLSMELVDKETKIRKGELVVTAGSSSLYPSGILIGEVSKVSDDPNGLTKVVLVRPAVDFSALDVVLVVKPR